MDRNLFTERLRQAAAAAQRLAAPSLIEDLPPAVTLLVRLNMSYGERHYPGDDGRAERLTCEEAVTLLWRDGRIPEWIDVSVTSETGDATIIELTCCGRYTRPNGTPFHVVGPVLPPSPDRRRFSIHHDFEVHDTSSHRRLTEVADRVRRLVIDTDLPVTAPPGVWLIRDIRCPHGSLAAYAGLPALRILQIEAPGHFTAAGSPIPALESLTVTGLPSRPWAMGALRALTPSLVQLTLTAADELWLEGQLPSGVRDIALTGTHLRGQALLPRTLDSLGLHFTGGLRESTTPAGPHFSTGSHESAAPDGPHFSTGSHESAAPDGPRFSTGSRESAAPEGSRFSTGSHESAALGGVRFSDGLRDVAALDGVRQVKHLSLRGTPVTPAVVDAVIARMNPARLDLTHTGLDESTRDRLEAAHPTVELLPRRGPLPSSGYEGIAIQFNLI